MARPKLPRCPHCKRSFHGNQGLAAHLRHNHKEASNGGNAFDEYNTRRVKARNNRHSDAVAPDPSLPAPAVDASKMINVIDSMIADHEKRVALLTAIRSATIQLVELGNHPPVL